MRQNILCFQEKVLKILSGKIDDFCLAGGTALSLYYFHHRESLDLDFFCREFSKIRILEIIKLLSGKLKKKIELTAEETREDRVKVAVYYIYFSKNKYLKLDFIEDYIGFIKPPQSINGIKILSCEDIYIRKIYAITGTVSLKDHIGREIMEGGRQEAKDFYDLYCLSSVFATLSKFSFKYCNQLTREALIRWFRTYDRLSIKTGLLELKLRKDIDYKEMEIHFKKEINRILEKEVESI